MNLKVKDLCHQTEVEKASDDIYYVKTLKPICDVLVSVTVDNADKDESISGALVSITDVQGK